MADRYLIGLLFHRVRMENVSEEVVIAIPLALVVQRNDKQVASLQGLQQHFAIFLFGDSIAQRSTQPVENGGLE